MGFQYKDVCAHEGGNSGVRTTSQENFANAVTLSMSRYFNSILLLMRDMLPYATFGKTGGVLPWAG